MPPSPISRGDDDGYDDMMMTLPPSPISRGDDNDNCDDDGYDDMMMMILVVVILCALFT